MWFFTVSKIKAHSAARIVVVMSRAIVKNPSSMDSRNQPSARQKYFKYLCDKGAYVGTLIHPRLAGERAHGEATTSATIEIVNPKEDIQHASLTGKSTIILLDDYFEANFTEVLNCGDEQLLPPYTLVTEVLLSYVPAEGGGAPEQPINVQIYDRMHNQGEEIRQCIMAGNVPWKLSLFLDHCVRTADLRELIVLMTHRKTLGETTSVWGKLDLSAQVVYLQKDTTSPN